MSTQLGSSASSFDTVVARLTQALAFTVTLLSASTGGATSSSSLGASSLTTSEWISATSCSTTDGHISSSAARLALAELKKASLVLRAISGDVSAPSIEYLESLGALLAPYEDATTFSLQDLGRITVGLEGAWAALVRDLTCTSLLAALVDIDPSLEDRLLPLDKLARHAVASTIQERADLSTLLRAHPELGEFILEAMQAASSVFGTRVSYRLEPFTDPESTTGNIRAYLMLQTQLPVSEADTLMDELDNKWWLDNSNRVDGRLSLALHYT